MQKPANKTLYLSRQEKKVIVSILNLRIKELKKWDPEIIEAYMFESTIQDIIKKLNES